MVSMRENVVLLTRDHEGGPTHTWKEGESNVVRIEQEPWGGAAVTVKLANGLFERLSFPAWRVVEYRCATSEKPS